MVRRAAGDRRQATAGPLPPLRHSPPPPALSASPPPVHLRPPALHGSKADGSSAPPPTVRHCLRRRSGLHLRRTPPPSGGWRRAGRKGSRGRRFCCINMFSSKEECEYLISLAEPHMKKLTVVDSATRGCE